MKDADEPPDEEVHEARSIIKAFFESKRLNVPIQENAKRSPKNVCHNI